MGGSGCSRLRPASSPVVAEGVEAVTLCSICGQAVRTDDERLPGEVVDTIRYHPTGFPAVDLYAHYRCAKGAISPLVSR